MKIIRRWKYVAGRVDLYSLLLLITPLNLQDSILVLLRGDFEYIAKYERNGG